LLEERATSGVVVDEADDAIARMERRGERLGRKPEAFRERRRRTGGVAPHHHLTLLLENADDDAARADRMRDDGALQHTHCKHGAERKSSNTSHRFAPKGRG
jgi:hypothetical protein